MAPQTLNTTRDVIHPRNDARGGGNINAPQTNFTEHSKLIPWLMLSSILSGFALAFSLLTYFTMHDQMVRTERAYSLLDLQIRDQNAVLIREGLKQPDDFVHGPSGNYLDPRIKPIKPKER